jgi:aspartyl-tRNA(Asn)/glutamyl-tRNA(Gln) amidotransferase subunit A
MAREIVTVQRAYEVLAGEPVAAVTVRRACRLRGGRWDRVDPAVTAALDEAAAALRGAGVVVDDVPWWEDELVPAVAVVQQRAAARVHEPLYAGHRDEYGADVRARVANALGIGEAEERAARAVIASARASWDAAARGYEIALAPSAGTEAPVSPAPPSFRDDTIPLVTPASGFGLPVAAVPIGFGAAEMPLGMQLIALGGDVAAAFAIARLYQQLTDWHRRVPPD